MTVTILHWIYLNLVRVQLVSLGFARACAARVQLVVLCVRMRVRRAEFCLGFARLTRRGSIRPLVCFLPATRSRCVVDLVLLLCIAYVERFNRARGFSLYLVAGRPVLFSFFCIVCVCLHR